MSRPRNVKKRATRSSKKLPPLPENVAKRKAIFLAARARCCTVRAASALTGIARSNHYEWMRTDPEYAQLFEDAKAESVEMMEDEVQRRAYDGVPVKKFHPKTGRAYMELQKSDTLLMFYLKAAAPEKYRERYDSHVTATVAHSGKIAVELPPLEPDDN